jgi:SAM-dependent methyltransferase
MSLDQDFWNTKHESNDLTWITGNYLQKYYQWLGISENDLRDKTVLEIGVGMGYASAQISQLCASLYCADISAKALRRVSLIAKDCYQTMDIKSAPPVDLALCHLVLVHCDDDEFVRIINDVNLLPNGRLIVQISGPGPGGLPERVNTEWPPGSHFFRSADQINDLVGRTNKKIVTQLPSRGILHGDWFPHVWHVVSLGTPST